MLIDHIIYAHPELDIGAALIEQQFGVRASGGGQHPGYGTHNKLLALGPRTYLEIIAPDPEQPEPANARPFGVDGITRGGLVGWAIGCDDIDAAQAAARSRGFDPGEVISGQRVGPTGTALRWRLTRNALAGGSIPFLISWGDIPHPAQSAPQGLLLESFHLEHPDPASIRPALAALGANVAVEPSAHVALVARLNGPNGSKELRGHARRSGA